MATNVYFTDTLEYHIQSAQRIRVLSVISRA